MEEQTMTIAKQYTGTQVVLPGLYLLVGTLLIFA